VASGDPPGGGGLHQAHLGNEREGADGAHGCGHRACERKGSGALHAEALAVAQAELVWDLEAHRAARKAELADETILLNEANGKLVLAASKANLFLDAKELALALAEDEAGNVVKVARQVVADEFLHN